MSLKIAFQMDHISTIDRKTDSTLMLIIEALNRGFEIFHFTPKDLFLLEGKIQAKIEKLEIFLEKDSFFQLSAERIVNLEEMDAIFIRQDPPFDMNYITNTYLLEKIKDKVKIINDPTEVRNAPEKILVCDFKEYMPETLITSDFTQLRIFAKNFKSIILKPLYDAGGDGVAKIDADFENLEEEFIRIIEKSKTPIMAQRYLPEIKKGDKRVILACGKVVGQVMRVPEKGKIAANFHAGGQAEKTNLTPKQQEVIAKLAPILMQKKLYFVGLDFIGDYITEINVTSPTGIQQINRLENKDITQNIWDNFLEIIK